MNKENELALKEWDQHLAAQSLRLFQAIFSRRVPYSGILNGLIPLG